MMQIPRAFATCLILLAMGLLAPLAEAKTARLKVKIENRPSSGMATTVTVALPADQIPADAKSATLMISGSGDSIPVQIVGPNAYWIMPVGKSTSAEAELILSTEPVQAQ